MFLSRACGMPLPLLPQLPPVKGEEPTPVCATPLQHVWEMFHKGTAPGLGWCQSLAGPRWLCHSTSARLTLPGSLMAGLECGKGSVGWCPRSAAGDPLQAPPSRGCCALEGLRSAESTLNFHSVFPGMAAHSCPASAWSVQHSQKTSPEQGLGGSDPSAGPLRGQAPQTLLAGQCPACSPDHIHMLGSALQPQGQLCPLLTPE